MIKVEDSFDKVLTVTLLRLRASGASPSLTTLVTPHITLTTTSNSSPETLLSSISLSNISSAFPQTWINTPKSLVLLFTVILSLELLKIWFWMLVLVLVFVAVPLMGLIVVLVVAVLALVPVVFRIVGWILLKILCGLPLIIFGFQNWVK